MMNADGFREFCSCKWKCPYSWINNKLVSIDFRTKNVENRKKESRLVLFPRVTGGFIKFRDKCLEINYLLFLFVHPSPFLSIRNI